jgi:sortase A
MALLEKKRNQGKRYQERRVRKRLYKKRRRTGLFVFVGLVVLTLLALVFFGTDLALRPDGSVIDRVEEPTGAAAPDAVFEGGANEGTDEEETTEEEEEKAAPTPPDDPTLYMTIPKLGISGAVVVDGEAGLELGAQHLEGTGYPWQKGANVYIAGHRVGWPGTGSDHIFYSLPSMSEGDEITLHDSLGQEYTYRVSKVFAVTPFDLWVTEPVAGRDMITLQVCTESPDDWWTIGPSLMSSGPDSGRLMVQADLVS